jgi:hypothetical protein
VTVRCTLAFILAAALIAGGCSPQPESPAAVAHAEMVRLLDSLAPAANAERQDDVAWYDEENLPEAIQGAAGFFIEAGFVQLARSRWRAADAQGPAGVELDLFDMGSPHGALDVLADIRSPKNVPLDIGDEAQQTDTGLEMRLGRYYVRLTALRNAVSQQDLVLALAEALAKAAPRGPPETTLVSPLPPANLIPHTVTYVAKGFLGRAFLEKVHAASYRVNDQRIQLFIMNAGSPEQARSVLSQWRSVLPPQPLGTVEAVDRMEWDEETVGPVVVVAAGRWLVGAIGDPATTRSRLEQLISRLN